MPDSPLSPEDMRLLPGINDALTSIISKGYRTFVVTNQPAAAKGKTSLSNLYEVNHKLSDLLAKEGVFLDAILMCPHHPSGVPGAKDPALIRECNCRKPKTGLFEKAAERYGILKESSYMVGDSEGDIAAGQAFGVKTVYLRQGRENRCADGPKSDLVLDNLCEFARLITENR